MEVLIVSQYYWPESFRVNDLARGLTERGHKVTVLTGVPNYPAGKIYSGYGFFSPARESQEGVRIVRVPLYPRGKGRRWELALNYISFVITGCLFGPFRCRGPYDVILVFQMSPATMGLPAVLLRHLKKVPMVLWVQDLWPESLSAAGAVSSKRLIGLVRRIVHFMYRRSDRILVQSRKFRAHIEAVGGNPGRIDYLPNWAESVYQTVFVEDNAEERKELPDGFKVMFAGNIGSAQSFETILDAATLLKDSKDIHWVVIGDGLRKGWVEDQVKARDLAQTVHLLGRREVELMPRYFALADALLVTLRKEPIFALTIPSKVQSYLACARPIVAALDGEGAHVVQEAKAGLTVPAGDAAGLAGIVKKLYEQEEDQRQAMGRSGREYFEQNFDREILVDRLVGWMEETRRQPLCAS